jgi:hypothetical protein
MAQKLYPLLVVMLFILCAFGWGRLMRHFLDRRIFVFHSLTAIVGLAVLGALGGLLNLIHLATMTAWLVLLGIGLSATTHYLLHKRPWRQRAFPLESIPLFVAPVITFGMALLLMPSGVFNTGDDFQTYITRATRMMQTGSLAGNAFDCLGLDSLGSPSFFHLFFLVAGGAELLNGFDAVVCFGLCLLLLAELSLRWRLPWWLGICGVLGLVWINPQYVNISPLYAGAAGVMALILCGVLLARSLVGNRKTSTSRLAVSMGLIAAWLATMKITFSFFVAAYLSALLLVLLVLAVHRRAVLKSAAAGALTIAVCMLPWALVPLPALLRARHAAEPLMSGASLSHQYPTVVSRGTAGLFEPVALLYGNTPVFYLTVSAVALGLGIAGVVHWLGRGRDPRLCGTLAVGAGGVAIFATLLLNSHLFPISMAIRFSCPILIGGVFMVAFGFVRSRTSASTASRKWVSAGVATACAVLIVSFNTTFRERLDIMRQSQTMLSFPFKQSYAAYSRDTFTNLQTSYYHTCLQTNIPTGSTAFVWTTTPFLFDFQRNQLQTFYVAGIGNPLLQFPAGVSPKALEQYFRHNDIQFIILQTNGYGVAGLPELRRTQGSPSAYYRQIGDFGIYLRTNLLDLAARGKVLYSDDQILIFRLGDGSAPSSNSSNTISSL